VVTFEPLAADVPRIRAWLVAFRVSAAVTGVFLILLVVMMIVRYGFHADLAIGEAAGGIGMLTRNEADPAGPTAWWPEGTINLSTIILIVHGWLYVVYLVVDFALWRLVRYSFGYFLLVALGGVVPFLSFVFEWRVPRDITARIASLVESEVSPA